jgi:hypothetical protein
MTAADSTTSRILEFRKPDNGWTVVLEDDGKVCYAYLRSAEGNTTSDVWLYNRAETPELPEWKQPAALPFRNPKAYVVEWSPPTDLRSADARVRWFDSPNGAAAQVWLWRELFGVLRSGARSGWSKLAVRAGPLALPLSALPEG